MSCQFTYEEHKGLEYPHILVIQRVKPEISDKTLYTVDTSYQNLHLTIRSICKWSFRTYGFNSYRINQLDLTSGAFNIGFRTKSEAIGARLGVETHG